MNKTELIEVVAAQAGISKEKAAKAVNALLEAVAGELHNGEDVSLFGFGTFTVRERALRKGRNPKTGEPISIASTKVPTFRPAKALKIAVGDDRTGGGGPGIKKD
ncbi:HU family DNA-binding protein [Shewanella baltica]|uniref:HU family DNA-binding protein n=1 Tax=Shewanella baltica TaxID=62322 RepID=UPI0032181162